MDQLLKPCVATQGIEVRMYFKQSQNAGLFLISPFKPSEGLLVVAEAQVGVYKRGGGNIGGLLSLFQLLEQTKRLRTSPCVRICPYKDTHDGGTPAGERGRFLEGYDGLVGLAVCGQCVP